MSRLLYFLVLVVDIYFIYEIIKSNKDSNSKLLWILAILFLPLLGPILYLLFGKKS
ncbi:MAG: PLDc_N domain-containing protein [Flammeovirgaceae bacterium]|nr:PLDc_N domain-containing protein [Flammeovirgaceae bacterium]